LWLIGWVPRLGAIWLARVDLPAECFRVRYASLPRYCTKLCLLGFFAISASFSRNFSGLWAGFGSCFGDFCGFSYFFLGFFRLLGWVWELFWRFLRFQLLFSRIFFGFWVGFGSCFGNFCGFSYFFLDFFRLLGLILGAVLKVLWITAPQEPAYYAINLWLLYIMLI